MSRPKLAVHGHFYQPERRDPFSGEIAPQPAARLTWYPVETVSNSEGGFERVYQGSSLLFRWPVTLAPGEARAFTVHFVVAQTIDHAMAELG